MRTIKVVAIIVGLVVGSLAVIISILLFLFYQFFCDPKTLPKGEYDYESVSPDGNYTIEVYISSKSLSSDAVRCELTNNITGKSRNIYWNLAWENLDITWKDSETVIIGGIELNLIRDTYDFRSDPNWQNPRSIPQYLS